MCILLLKPKLSPSPCWPISLVRQKLGLWRAPAMQVLLGSLVVSFGPIMVKGIDATAPSLGFFRMLTGVVVFALLSLFLSRGRIIGQRTFLIAALGGALLSCDLTFWHRSIRLIGPGFATIIGNFQVFIIGAVAVLLWQEKLRISYYAGVALALFGLVISLGDQLVSPVGLSSAGVIFGLLSSIAYAAFVVALKYQTPSRTLSDSFQTMFVLCCSGLLSFLLEGIFVGDAAWVVPDKSIAPVILYGLTSQVVGWLLIARAAPFVPISRTAVLLLVQPLGAYVWEILLLGRTVTLVELFGAALMLVGVLLGSSSRVVNRKQTGVIDCSSSGRP